MVKNENAFTTVSYNKGVLTLLDQTKLPIEETYIDFKTVEGVARAIETMVVRGAPAIGVTAAYGIALAAHRGEDIGESHERLSRTRPTAVNLFWALDRMKSVWSQGATLSCIEKEAHDIYKEDVESCRKIGEYGAEFIDDGATILTHCNAGAWELMKDGIDVTVVPDSALAHLLSKDLIDCAVVGSDRIAANGDVANKIGTRSVACLLHLHGRPLYVAAPWSTIDMSLENGAMIPIEERIIGMQK